MIFTILLCVACWLASSAAAAYIVTSVWLVHDESYGKSEVRPSLLYPFAALTFPWLFLGHWLAERSRNQ